MFFKPNLPVFERIVRVCLGLCLMSAGLLLEWPQWAVWLAVISGCTSALTALVGFCPACAMVGRRSIDGP